MSLRHTILDRRRWARVRLAVLKGANWRCTRCGRYGNEVDHIVPLHRGGDPWALDNLQVLCRSCHIQKTRRENRRELTPAEAAWRKMVDDLLSSDTLR